MRAIKYLCLSLVVVSCYFLHCTNSTSTAELELSALDLSLSSRQGTSPSQLSKAIESALAVTSPPLVGCGNWWPMDLYRYISPTCSSTKEMIPKCCEESSADPQGNPDPGPGFVVDGTSKFQVKQSKKKLHLKACDRNEKEHIYLNVKHRTAKKQTRRQRTEGDKDTKNKGSPVSSTTCWIIAVILGILFLALLGTTVGFIIKGCSCPCCPEQWVTYRGRCYSFSKEKKDWNSSQEFCRAQGAHLLVISNISEMDFFQIQHTKSHWIGLQRSTDGDWAWEDGSKLSDKKVKSSSRVQRCAVLLDGAIHASSCEVPTPWICEKSV